VAGRISLRDAATYWVAQFIGGVLAALAHERSFPRKRRRQWASPPLRADVGRKGRPWPGLTNGEAMRLLFCSRASGALQSLVPHRGRARTGRRAFRGRSTKPRQEVEELGVEHYLSDSPDPTKSKELWRRAARLPHAQAARLLDGEFFGRLSTDAMLAPSKQRATSFNRTWSFENPAPTPGRGRAPAFHRPRASRDLDGAYRMERHQTRRLHFEDFEAAWNRCCARPATSLECHEPGPSPFPIRCGTERTCPGGSSPALAEGGGPLIYLTFGSVAGPRHRRISLSEGD